LKKTGHSIIPFDWWPVFESGAATMVDMHDMDGSAPTDLVVHTIGN